MAIQWGGDESYEVNSFFYCVLTYQYIFFFMAGRCLSFFFFYKCEVKIKGLGITEIRVYAILTQVSRSTIRYWHCLCHDMMKSLFSGRTFGRHHHIIYAYINLYAGIRGIHNKIRTREHRNMIIILLNITFTSTVRIIIIYAIGAKIIPLKNSKIRRG